MKIVASLLLLFLSTNLCAQQPLVTGRVLSINNTPMGGINVILKGTSLATATDMNGYFEIQLPEGDVALIFSYLKQKPLEYFFFTRQGFQYQVKVKMAAQNQTFNRGEALASELPLSAARIKGRIVDQGGRPLAGVLVSQLESSFDAVSGADGSFTLPVPAGPNILSFRSNGVKEFNYSLEARQEGDLIVEISLVEDKPKYRKLQASAKEYPSRAGNP